MPKQLNNSDLNILQEASKPSLKGKTTLEEVNIAVIDYIGKTQELEILEAKVKRLKNQLHLIESDSLPSLLREAGVNELTTSGGTKVKIKQFVKASVPTANTLARMATGPEKQDLQRRRELAFDWLHEHGQESLIKSTVEVAFSRDSQALKTQCVRLLDAAGFACESNEEVNPMTLSKWVKEKMEAGESIPQDLFGVFTGEKAEIKTPRTKF